MKDLSSINYVLIVRLISVHVCFVYVFFCLLNSENKIGPFFACTFALNDGLFSLLVEYICSFG